MKEFLFYNLATLQKMVDGLLVIICGYVLSFYARKYIAKILQSRWGDSPANHLISHVIFYIILLFFILNGLTAIGMSVRSFLVAMSAVGLGIGLALKDSLSNVAATFLIITNNFFKRNDLIEINSICGKVEEIMLLTTKLTTPDNKVVFVPNSSLLNDGMINYTKARNRRIDINIGVAYDSDIAKVKKTLIQVAEAEERRIPNSDIEVLMTDFGDSSINLTYRVWVKTKDYLEVKSDLIENIKMAFEKNNIEIPFPQRDIFIKNDGINFSKEK